MKTRSAGVKATGIILIVAGVLGFVCSTLSSYLVLADGPGFGRMVGFLGTFHKVVRGGDFPLSQAVDIGYEGSRIVFYEHPAVYGMWALLMPLWFLLFFLGGIGILKLRNEWRKTVLVVVPLWGLTKLIIDIFMYSYFVMFVAMGKLLDPVIREVPALTAGKIFRLLPDLLTRKLLVESLLVAAIVFFLTRPAVRDQFGRTTETA